MNSDKLNGIGVWFRFYSPFIGTIATIMSTLVFLYLGNLRTELLETKIESRANFSKLEAVAKVNFDKIDNQLNNHLTRHQQLDKELCERLSRVETLLNQR